MNNFSNAYAPIVKYDKNGDGTLMVYGKATDDSLDIDQQICDAGWLDRAMPEWFKSGGNIREQHSNIAAGVAKEYESKEDGHYITTLVVDPVSVKKVETGVLKGFSIGIKSPRVVRDTKAVNGRIIDGQIVEVSLVDRPANPNAKLIMAKSVDGESSLIQVEEFHEFKAPIPSELFPPKIGKAGALIRQAKTIAPEIKKFDQATFDSARQALAQLVIVEAQEMKDGEDETTSLNLLLNAVKSLFDWYNHEAAEGEVSMEETVEMSAHTDDESVTKDPSTTCSCKCGKCAMAKGCDSKECSCKGSMAKESDSETEKSVTGNKCLECGCDKPSDSHGRSDVSTAEMVDHQPKSAEGEEAIVAEETPTETVTETPAEEPKADDEVSTESTEEIEVLAEEKTLLGDSQITEILEKAVKSAKESVQAEIDLIKSEKSAAENKVSELESKLAEAVTKAVAGGPKRSVAKAGNQNEKNDLLAKADEYSRKAASTTDPDLAVGYRSLAKEFMAKAGNPSDSE